MTGKGGVMAHRYLQEYAQMRRLIYVDCDRFGHDIRAITGDENLQSSAIWNRLNDFYSAKALDADIELADAVGKPCLDVASASKIAMNTGFRTKDDDAIWIYGSRARGTKTMGVFWAQYMDVRYAELTSGHRLLPVYQELTGFVYLYPKYLAENLVENAGAILGPAQSQAYLVHRLTEAYRHAADEEIRVTCNGKPCDVEMADEIIMPTGYFNADGKAVYMHCEPSDAGRDYPWCLHFFKAAGCEMADSRISELREAVEIQEDQRSMPGGLWGRIVKSIFRRN